MINAPLNQAPEIDFSTVVIALCIDLHQSGIAYIPSNLIHAAVTFSKQLDNLGNEPEENMFFFTVDQAIRSAKEIHFWLNTVRSWDKEHFQLTHLINDIQHMRSMLERAKQMAIEEVVAASRKGKM